MAAARLAGVDRLFRMGGAHAIAALAYGTQAVPRVDKIVGPGNRFVAAAKSLVATDCAIDFYAGPTEIVIVSDRGNPRMDRGRSDRAGGTRPAGARDSDYVQRQAGGARGALREGAHAGGRSRARVARPSRRHHRHARASENPPRWPTAPRRSTSSAMMRRSAAAVTCAGAIFVGPYTAQVAGDYAIGSNHVLPTNGAARFRGGLHAADFVRVSTVQRMTRRGPADAGAHRHHAGAAGGPGRRMRDPSR